jgi:hypothetical protein
LKAITLALIKAVAGAVLVCLALTTAAASAEVSATATPSSYVCTAVTAANEAEPPPPLWMTTGIMPSEEEVEIAEDAATLCPKGQVPQMHPTYGVAPVDPSLSPKPLATHEEEGSYFYAGDIWQVGGIGMQFGGQVSQPTVSSFKEAHSIDQLAEESDGGATDTMEEGWIVSPDQFASNSPDSPHLFTYVNKDHYTSNGEPGGDCYDCEFVPRTEAKFSPGEALTPTKKAVEFAVEYHEGNWWINYDNEWIGYCKGSFWPTGFSHSLVHQVYGEVFDNSADPTTQMGDGKFGTEAKATKEQAPINFITEDERETQGLHNPPENVPTPEYYSIGKINKKRTTWQFGGPGKKSENT